MKEELNLSEKRKELRKDIKKTENKRDINFLFSLLDIIEKQDKKFIKRLKEEHSEWRKEGVIGEYFTDSFEIIIDKLAGEKLK